MSWWVGARCDRDEPCFLSPSCYLEYWRFPLNAEALARTVADLALDKKALEVVILDLRGFASYADFIVVASGTSDRHVQSIAEWVEHEVAEVDTRAIGVEGLREGQWALVDFGAVVLHVFHQYTREVYNLEAMWRGAPRLLLAPQKAPAATQVRS